MSESENKKLEYYMGLPYVICVLKDMECGTYAVWCPELPGCITQVDNLQDVPRMIDDAKRCWIRTAIKSNTPIPEPAGEREYSGEFKLRLPKFLHKELKDRARAKGISLNQLCIQLLEQGMKIK